MTDTNKSVNKDTFAKEFVPVMAMKNDTPPNILELEQIYNHPTTMTVAQAAAALVFWRSQGSPWPLMKFLRP